MQHLVIKPTLACTANCLTCAYRRELHKQVRREKWLSFEDWQRVLAEARDLGNWHLTISGGEPTLYKQLPDLIRIGRNYGWLVRVNSNGSLINREYAEKLIAAGLNVIDISLYSPKPAVHDEIRKIEGLWDKATSAIRLCSDLSNRYRKFTVISQTILCHENFMDFAELLQLHYELGSSGLLVSFLEGDFEKKHLFSINEIQIFREQILPKAIAVCEKMDPNVKNIAISRVKQIFSTDILDTNYWANGIYRPVRKGCNIPKKQALVLANGDIHPCNIVEYAHEPVMGNLFKNTLTEIWQGREWENFRLHLHDKCELCPMNHHVYIPLRPGNKWVAMAKSWMQRLHLDQVEEIVYPMVKKTKARILKAVHKK